VQRAPWFFVLRFSFQRYVSGTLTMSFVGSKLDARKGFVDFDALGEVVLSEWTAHGAQELADHKRDAHSLCVCAWRRGLLFDFF
jgi:hypothetical protein